MVLNETDSDSCKIYSLSWTEFSSSLSVAAQKLRKREDFIDVTINAGGRNFPAHKLVLGAASPLLMDLLKNTTCHHPILMLAGISAFDLETILKFIYHGEVNIDAEKLPALLQAAQFLDIRALSPAALVLNSLPSASPTCTTTIENKKTSSNDDILPQQNDENGVKNETKILLNKRKRRKKLDSFLKRSTLHSDVNDVMQNELLKKSFEENEISKLASKVTFSNKSNDSFIQEEGTLIPDEKKIVSDLPVNCKLCGVTIRQSRNLRRHIDQMHSKTKIRKIEDQTEKHIENESTEENINATNDASTTSLLDFSDESFNQLTEEIFNCSTIPVEDTNSFSNSSSTSPNPANNCLATEMIQTTPPSSATHSTLLYTLSGGYGVPPFNTLLGELCYHVPTNTTAMPSNCHSSTENNKLLTETCSANENFNYTRLGSDSSNSNEDTQDIMILKELDNQLLSACFCTAENDG